MTVWIRPFHRWVSMVFVVVVAANFVAMGLGQTIMWLTLLPLLPLLLLTLSGLYLFALPYAAKWRTHIKRP